MPRLAINYSNVSFYKLCCNDLSITKIYIGSTTNFKNRKATHKSKASSLKYNAYLYQYIRSNGGWDNWSMIELENRSCSGSNEQLLIERKHMENLHAELNTLRPIVSIEECIEYQQQYRVNNHQAYLEYLKTYRIVNHDKGLDYGRTYRLENRDLINLKQKNKRLLKLL